MALTPEQIYKLGAESLGWNNGTTAGKALIAEDLQLLKQLRLRFKQALSSPFDLGQEAIIHLLKFSKTDKRWDIRGPSGASAMVDLVTGAENT